MSLHELAGSHVSVVNFWFVACKMAVASLLPEFDVGEWCDRFVFDAVVAVDCDEDMPQPNLKENEDGSEKMNVCSIFWYCKTEYDWDQRKISNKIMN